MELFKKMFGMLAVLSIGFISCQKDFTIEDGPDPVEPPGVNDSIYLNKLYQVDSVAGVNDSIFLTTFFYDGQKRVQLSTDSIKEAGGWFLFRTEKFQYSGADTIPFKKVTYDYEKALGSADPTAIDSTISYYQYNAAGRNIYDSTVEVEIENDVPPYEYTSTITVKKYQYNGNNIYGEVMVMDEIGTLMRHGRDTSITDVNGNIIASKYYMVNGAVTDLVFTNSFTYDTKIDPFCRLSICRSFDVLPFEESYQLLQGKNNRTKNIILDSGGAPYLEDNTVYTYNSINFPVKHQHTESDYPGIIFKAFYTYRAL
ncbi:MAG: hypothetical protein H7Y86_21110 [Rhizobacter sp.]|nr:hypothetical protein [Ferruginibacter sp.]